MTASPHSTRECQQADCPFNETGACLEQIIPIETCPHLVERYDTDEDADQEVTDDLSDTQGLSPIKPTTSPQALGVPVYSGEALIGEQADALASEAETTVVIVAGDVDSGKTTLIGCSYSSFLEGPVGAWMFAGSRTLLGYDRRVHDHRVSSNRDAPVTEHTPLGVDEYYHLDVQSSTAKRRRRLLLHDISGEAYQKAIDQSRGAEELAMLRRADVIVILLDGTRLLKRSQRAEAVSRLLDLLLAVTKVGHLSKEPPVQIVVSRWDHVAAADNAVEISEQLEQIRSRVEKRLRELNIGSAVSIHGVASITHDNITPAGYGYPEVFDFWATLRPKAQPALTDTIPDGERQEGWNAMGRGKHSGEDHV